MDKLQKHDYMNQIEEFLENNQVYELFEDLLKQLVVSKPENPLDFIIQSLSNKKRNPLPTINFLSSQKNFLFGSARQQRDRKCYGYR